MHHSLICVAFHFRRDARLDTSWTEFNTGSRPTIPKAMPSIGPGVVELRIWDEAGTFRVIYVAKLVNAVYVLHCFQKKTQKTSIRDIELARKRLQDLKKEVAS